MTTADRWTRTMRERLGLGRLLPLGGPRDGAWIAERAAREVLLAAAREVAGACPGVLRVGLADPRDVREPAVPPPLGALPPGPLRVTADFTATVGGAAAAAEPLPATAARLRAALAEAAADGLGLAVTDVDLRATGLLDTPADAACGQEPRGSRPDDGTEPGPADATADDDGGGVDDGDEGRVARAALGVPGVVRMTGVLGRPVHVTEPPAREGALPRRHVRVELAVAADHRAVEVARRVRAAVSEALPDRPSVAVVVTAVG
ncbi:nucleopolyhedrovirus P10 family protein [Streptomyces sp. WAC 04229]|uniref:nucleopolyhedrovirus P10 family protein n=1 Tax=Streptomyces sp. WAC 04229 TaxID=2203206 RepID=UPI000F73E72D|nr:nucleopolyhedrovirus P10 family protein [Streptomyces sp. WAC 04229]RSN53233.1 nucleopolyhedrovirus P10 family protein [Streptomyces sp. WAC 04229]